MDKTNLKERFKKLTVWKNGEKRAPHKPLLVLYAIGRLLRSNDRLMPYENIDEELGKLLREFGPNRSSYRTEYPFWRLQNDHIWEVANAENVELTPSGDAKKSSLIRCDALGGFSDDVFQQLRNDPQLVQDIVQSLLDAHFPSSVHEDVLQSVGIDISPEESTQRRRDPKFRERVLRAYEYRCAICGFDVRLGHYPIALEAAHIKWHIAGGPDIEENGLALCTLHHKLFDLGAFTLSGSFEILVSDHAYGTHGFQEWLMRFHGGKLKLPQRLDYLPNEDFRDWHIREVFQGDYREL
jgi:putative restriction endonuclease